MVMINALHKNGSKEDIVVLSREVTETVNAGEVGIVRNVEAFQRTRRHYLRI
jgi:hypothetical protein